MNDSSSYEEDYSYTISATSSPHGSEDDQEHPSTEKHEGNNRESSSSEFSSSSELDDVELIQDAEDIILNKPSGGTTDTHRYPRREVKGDQLHGQGGDKKSAATKPDTNIVCHDTSATRKQTKQCAEQKTQSQVQPVIVYDSYEDPRCTVHGCPSKTFCRQCKRIVCNKCQDKHTNKMTVDEFIHSDLIDTTKKLLFECISNAGRIKGEYVENVLRLQEQYELSKGDLANMEDCVKNKDENEAIDAGLITKTIEAIRASQLCAKTGALSIACDEAARAVDVIDKIRAELESNKKKLAEMKATHIEIRRALICAEILVANITTVETITASCVLNSEQMLALGLLQQMQILPHAKCNINTDIEHFVAFDGANTVEGIQDASQKELQQHESGFSFSEPVLCHKITVTGSPLCTSVSHTGIVAIYCDATKSVHLADLFSKRRAVYKKAEPTSVAFYDDKALLMTRSEKPSVLPISKAFSVDGETSYETIFTARRVRAGIDVSKVNNTRMVIYRSPDNQINELNVDTLECKTMYAGILAQSLGFTTGIDIGVKAVFRATRHGNSACALTNDGKMVDIGVNLPTSLMYVLPASEDHKDLNMASFWCWDKKVRYRETVTRVASPLCYDGSHSIARVYKDVFLMYDLTTKRWYFIRISC